jgi:hypothetical protein
MPTGIFKPILKHESSADVASHRNHDHRYQKNRPIVFTKKKIGDLKGPREYYYNEQK